jgi:parallel beta-helix repeat protein
MKRTSQLLVGLLVVLVAAIAPTVASGTTGTLTITQNTTLTENHQGNIVIAANNITLDCAGHMVTGSGDGIGVDLSGHSGVTVKNCRVTDFNIGFFMIGGGGNTLIGNTANTISGNAFRVFSANNILIGNKADGTGSPDSAEGFFVSYIFGSKYNLLQRNEATNFQCGFRLSADPTTDNTLTGNVASSNTVGFCLLEVSRNTLTGNVANNNGTGFQIAGTAPGHLTTDLTP